jgi:hypothetical protein
MIFNIQKSVGSGSYRMLVHTFISYLALKFIHLLDHITTLFMIWSEKFHRVTRAYWFTMNRILLPSTNIKYSWRQRGSFSLQNIVMFIYQQNYHVPSNIEHTMFMFVPNKTDKNRKETAWSVTIRRFKSSGMWYCVKQDQGTTNPWNTWNFSSSDTASRQEPEFSSTWSCQLNFSG